MNARARKIIDEALELPEEDRALVIAELQESLEPIESPEEVEAAWTEEIARRVQSVQDGTAVLLDGDTVLRELKTKYGR